MRRSLPVLISLVAGASCAGDLPPLPPVDVAVHRDSVEQWHVFRQNAIYGPRGWATMVGLWWLKPGESTIGSDSSNTMVLPAAIAPPRLGSLHISADSAWFIAARGTTVTVDTSPAPVTTTRVRSDLQPGATVLRTGNLMIHYIVREDRGTFVHGVRIRDTASANRVAPPLRYFPTDIKWRVQAKYRPSAKPDSVSIIGVLGMETRMSHEGDLEFTLEGQKRSLMVIREPEDHGVNLFVMFTDSTNRKETYPSTRYVWVTPPDSLGRTVIDFNKAFNPPCAFTAYSTCPFPPRGNHLPIYVTAGEWNPKYVEKP